MAALLDIAGGNMVIRGRDGTKRLDTADRLPTIIGTTGFGYLRVPYTGVIIPNYARGRKVSSTPDLYDWYVPQMKRSITWPLPLHDHVPELPDFFLVKYQTFNGDASVWDNDDTPVFLLDAGRTTPSGAYRYSAGGSIEIFRRINISGGIWLRAFMTFVFRRSSGVVDFGVELTIGIEEQNSNDYSTNYPGGNSAGFSIEGEVTYGRLL